MLRFSPRPSRLAGLIALLALPLALALALPTAGSAAPESPTIARIVESGQLRVGMSGNQPPLNFKSKSGEIIGLEVDLVRALSAMMGVEAKIVQKPFGELLGALSAGEVDLVVSGMTITPGRNMKAAFIGPYQLSGKSILTKSSTLAQADEAEDLDSPQTKLAALKGSTSEDFVKAFVPNADLTSTKDYDTAVQLLLDDKVQAVVADYEICELTAMRNRKERLATLSRPLTIEPLGIAVAPGDPLFLNLLETTLGALEASGVLESLRNRWLGSGDWLSQLP